MLSHVRQGSGEPLVLIHGIGSQWAAAAVMATRNLATSPGFQATLPLLGAVQREDPGVPVTIARGARDRLLIPRQAARARSAMPGARHSLLHGCGHVPTRDDPELVAGVLLAGSHG